MRRTTIFAVVAAALMLLSVATPAVAASEDDGSLSVSVAQTDAGDATVTVETTQGNNSTAAEGASVSVATVEENATYDGTGDYTTGANGTVSLPAPNETVEISVTADYENASASTTATLSAETANETDENETDDGNATAFGQEVSAFVHQLQISDGDNSTSGDYDGAQNMGVVVATFVTEHNPGNAPAHAGPPAWLVNDSVNKTTGPPEHAGPSDDKAGGPPENKSGGPPEDKGKDDKGGGPPDHAKNGDDEDDSDE